VIISHSHEFIFIKTKKTAGTSIEVYLAPQCGDKDVVTPVGEEEATHDHRPRNYRGPINPLAEAFGLLGAPTEWRDIDGGGALKPFGHLLKGKRFYNHIPAYRVEKRIGPEAWRRYYTFTVERNPWDKAISQYYWKARRRTGYTFADFVAERDVGVNYPRYCRPRTREIMVDRIVYFHRLNEGLSEVCERVGVPFPGALPVRAKASTRSDRKPYQELFAGELAPYRTAIDELFAVEIEMHGWDFASGLPAGDR
jgi:hypothetical protein